MFKLARALVFGSLAFIAATACGDGGEKDSAEPQKRETPEPQPTSSTSTTSTQVTADTGTITVPGWFAVRVYPWNQVTGVLDPVKVDALRYQTPAADEYAAYNTRGPHVDNDDGALGAPDASCDPATYAALTDFDAWLYLSAPTAVLHGGDTVTVHLVTEASCPGSNSGTVEVAAAASSDETANRVVLGVCAPEDSPCAFVIPN